MHLVPDNAYGRAAKGRAGEGRKEGQPWRHLAQPPSLCRPSSSSPSFRSLSFNLLTRAEKERENGMERRGKGEKERGASKRTNRVRFYPVSRTTECGARLRTNHPPLCNYLSLFLSAGEAVGPYLRRQRTRTALQFRRNLCQRGPPTSHVRSGALRE